MSEGKPIPVWGEGGSKIVDWAWCSDEDYPLLKAHRWYLSEGYAYRSMYRDDGSKTSIPMHREVKGLENGDPREVDHIDRDRLNNRRSNLRVCDRYENEGNKPKGPGDSSKFLGVTRDHRTGRWKAQAHYKGEYVYLGTFDDEASAALARQLFDRKHGRFRTGPEGTVAASGALLPQRVPSDDNPSDGCGD